MRWIRRFIRWWERGWWVRNIVAFHLEISELSRDNSMPEPTMAKTVTSWLVKSSLWDDASIDEVRSIIRLCDSRVVEIESLEVIR